jgi:hypothetical protein
MTYMFDSSERLTREATFLSAFELEYNRLADSGLTQRQREEAAIVKAKDIVYQTLGNYGAYNRIPIMQGNALARAIFQFKMFAVIQTKFFVSNFRTLMKAAVRSGDLEPGEAQQATKELIGVLGATWLFSGVVGFPLWSIGMMALRALGLADADPEDEEYYREFEDRPEQYVKYVWMPDKFGEPKFSTFDGRERSLAEVLLYGPATTFSGMDIGSRTSLDLKNMFFPSSSNGATWKEVVGNGLLDSIPAVSNLAGMADGIITMQDGNLARGLERAMPVAIARSTLKGVRLASEGDITGAGRSRLSKEELNNADIIGAVFGVNPKEIAERQQYARDVYSKEQDYVSEKAAITQRYSKAIRQRYYGDVDGETVAREIQRVREEIAEFNAKAPTRLRFKPDYLITAEKSIRADMLGDRDGISLDEAAAATYQNFTADFDS